MKRPELVPYLDYREINGGTSSTLTEFQQELAKFPRNSIVRLCSAMNSVVATWLGDFDLEVQRRFVRSFFPPVLAQHIVALNRPIFHRQQLLFVIQQAFQHCALPDAPNVEPYFGSVGKMLLMANDHLQEPTPEKWADTTLEKAIQVIVALLPSLEANNYSNYLNRIARSSVMLSRFVEPLRGQENFFDVSTLFQQSTTIPLDTFLALIWATMSRFAKVETLRNTQDVSLLSVTPEWYGTVAPRTMIDSYLDDLSSEPDEFAAVLQEKTPNPSDFTILRAKPLFKDSGRFFPIDFTFLSDKIESGIFWRVHNALPTRKEKDRFHEFWGNVFEQYMNHLLEHSCTNETNRFYPNPHYLNAPNEQVCDGLILCGTAAILMEYKGSTFTAASKYGGDVSTMRAEVEAKLVGDDDRRKGVRQLAHAIERLCRRENPDAIQGIEMSGVTVMMPLLVTRDDIGSAWGMNAYLNKRFQELKPVQKRVCAVSPLFCLSANDVELASSYLSDTRLFDILMARYKEEPPLMTSLWTTENRVLAAKEFKKPQFVFDELSHLTAMVVRVLGLTPPA